MKKKRESYARGFRKVRVDYDFASVPEQCWFTETSTRKVMSDRQTKPQNAIQKGV